MRRHSKGPDRALWSVCKLGKAVGLSHTGVQRIWAAHGLKPHLAKSFKLSNDPHFKSVFNDCMLELDLIGSYRFLVPFQADTGHVRNVKQAILDFVWLL